MFSQCLSHLDHIYHFKIGNRASRILVSYLNSAFELKLLKTGVTCSPSPALRSVKGEGGSLTPILL